MPKHSPANGDLYKSALAAAASVWEHSQLRKVTSGRWTQEATFAPHVLGSRRVCFFPTVSQLPPRFFFISLVTPTCEAAWWLCQVEAPRSLHQRQRRNSKVLRRLYEALFEGRSLAAR